MTIMGSGLVWFEQFLGVPHHYLNVAHGLVVFTIILISALVFKSSVKSVEQEVIPSGDVSIKNIFQLFVEGVLSLMKNIVPHDAEDYLPMAATLFVFIFLSNLMGVIPGFLPPTESIITNLSIAVTVFIYYHAMGIKKQGIKAYLEHFIGPSLGSSFGMILLRVGFFAPLMFVIEIVSHSIRPLSLSLRLFGNINGDHMVLSVFSGLAPLLVPIIFLAFGIFVSFVQAFVFTLLSIIYIGLAVESHDHH